MSKKWIMPVVTGLVALGIGGSSVAAAGNYENPGGGTWHYGVGLTGTYSDYFHSSRRHQSSVRSGSKTVQKRAGAGSWSKARLTVFSGCEVFWGFY